MPSTNSLISLHIHNSQLLSWFFFLPGWYIIVDQQQGKWIRRFCSDKYTNYLPHCETAEAPAPSNLRSSQKTLAAFNFPWILSPVPRFTICSVGENGLWWNYLPFTALCCISCSRVLIASQLTVQFPFEIPILFALGPQRGLLWIPNIKRYKTLLRREIACTF